MLFGALHILKQAETRVQKIILQSDPKIYTKVLAQNKKKQSAPIRALHVQSSSPAAVLVSWGGGARR